RFENGLRSQFPLNVQQVLDHVGRANVGLHTIHVWRAESDERAARSDEILICDVRLIGNALIVAATPAAGKIETRIAGILRIEQTEAATDNTIGRWIVGDSEARSKIHFIGSDQPAMGMSRARHLERGWKAHVY